MRVPEPFADRIGRPAHRVQLHRTRGWRLPAGVQVCSRPGKYGNPLTMYHDQSAAAEWFDIGLGMRRGNTLPKGHSLWRYPSDLEITHELRGVDLACWCPPDGPCHVDTLLEVANAMCAQPGCTYPITICPETKPYWIHLVGGATSTRCPDLSVGMKDWHLMPHALFEPERRAS